MATTYFRGLLCTSLVALSFVNKHSQRRKLLPLQGIKAPHEVLTSVCSLFQAPGINNYDVHLARRIAFDLSAGSPPDVDIKVSRLLLQPFCNVKFCNYFEAKLAI